MSVTAPRGFVAAGVAAGLKASGRPDLGLLLSEQPASAAGLFTRNAFAAAPVEICRRRLLDGTARAVVANSGQANAGTGPPGFDDAEAVTTAVAHSLGIEATDVLPVSTGVIGPRLRVDAVVAGVEEASGVLHTLGGPEFAQAIMTTDTVAKQTVVEADGFTVGGCAKGAGMIAPDLATLLVFLTTDAACSPALAQDALRHGAAPVWNALTVDNCPSTNDTVLLLANGASGHEAGPDELAEAVAEATRDLAAQVVADAEGATTSIVVQVEGAVSDADARRVGTAIAGSMLVKTAVFGKDPNPGRILQAIGASGARFRPEAVVASLGRVQVIAAGAIPPQFDPAACAAAMKEREVVIRVTVGVGDGRATAFGCDLGYEYVRINGEYTT
ncbi:MAG TPA: bifunctional glutamate N-acetyltransferase/amino-acid acetyltransferase ArgJ [Actinomycetota bacterium]|nr:bifunctional glutamate N-acetyltransferase/amino-acid acetyltransferase ArgJ [Actinomycetota bacterium]